MILELKRFSEFVSKNPSNKLDLRLTVNNDLNRIVNKINHDSYFLAYKSLIKDDKIGPVLTNIDYLFETLQDISKYYISIHEKQQNERKDFLHSMHDLINVIVTNVNIYRESQGSLHEHYLFFDSYLKKYREFFTSDIDAILIFDEKFLTPLLTDIYYKNIPFEYKQVYDAANSSSIKLKRIVLNNNSNGAHLSNYGVILSESVQNLKELIIPLQNFIDR
ncbi:hypothetical protein [Spirosoma sp. KNUC1025]|uniref:hypothetical protein n=1 Tax=Spirosoma sp. KNUC1025 TaxID=2894082 RepID=UPI00386C5B0A|nr:hypothetical protein LN737_00655 [Spirosoma sp. KNUC1025]